MSGPLANTRVIELGAFISGPFATKILGDLGADVIKIERSDGDLTRRGFAYDDHDSLSHRFLNFNSSKQSITLDLSTDEGKKLLRELVDDADICVENLAPGAMERLDLAPETLRQRNPELVYCSIKGYGTRGPYADLPAFDTCVQGVSGFATQIGDVETPGAMNVLVVDMLTGLYAAMAAGMALYERTESGEGQHVDVSMLDAAVSVLGYQLAEYSGSKKREDYEAEYGAVLAPNGHFETADGYLSVILAEAHWGPFCTALGAPELAEDHRFATNEKRLNRREALRDELEAILRQRTTDEWVERFRDTEGTIPVAPVNEVDEMVADPQIQAMETVVARDHPELGRYHTPNVVPKFSRTPGAQSHAPDLGEHTEQVLSELGYTSAERKRLRDDGVVE